MANIIGGRIKSLRQDRNMTQRDLANALHIANTTLSQYESGQRVPSDDVKMQIANYFDVTIDYLLGLSSDRSNAKKSISNAQASEILKRKFIEHGIIKEGEDITDEQVDNYLKKLSVILDTLKDDTK